MRLAIMRKSVRTRPHLDIEFRNVIGSFHGTLPVLGVEGDSNNASPAPRPHLQMLQIGIENTVFRAFPRGIAQDAKKDKRLGNGARALNHRVEFRIAFDAEILDGAAGEIPRGDELRLAGSRPVTFHGAKSRKA